MPAIKLDKFQGIMPRVTDKLLPDRAAQTAENLDLLSGRLQPIEEPVVAQGSIGASQISAYLWRRNNTSEWLTWPYDVDVVKGPIADDDKERIYYIENGTMKVTGWDTVKETRALGLSSPSKPTTANVRLFNPSLITCTKYTQNDVSWGSQNDSGSEPTASLVSYYYGSDGEMILRYKVAAKQWPSMDGGITWVTYSSLSRTWSLFTISGAGTLPSSGDYFDDMQEGSIDLLDGTEKYGELSVSDISISGRSVNWKYESGYIGGATFWQRVTPLVSEYYVTYTCRMSYTERSTRYQYYVQTFVDDWGHESPPSSISALYESQPGMKTTVTLPGTTPAGENISKRRIYRSAAGTSEDEFFFLAEVDESTSTYIDNLDNSELGEVMPLFKNPESGMDGLIVMPGGFLAAFKGKTIYFSEPWLPYTWPTQYDLTIDYDVVALHASGNDIIVMTNGTPYIITGSHPELLTITRLMQKQSCVAKRGVTQVGSMVLYPSPDGLVGVSGGQAKLLTEKFYRKEDWDDISPSGLIAKCYDKKYHGWSGANSIIFDFDEGLSAITTTDETATGLHEDLQNDALYLIQGTDIVEWRGGSDKLKMTWRSKEFQLSKCYDWKVCRVISDSYPVDGSGEELTMKLYANNVLVLTREIFDNNAFQLPVMRPERIWSVEVEAYNAIDEIIIATSMSALKGA